MSIDLTLLYQVTYGMYILGAQLEGKPAGCIVNTCMQITSENPIFAVSVNRENATHDVVVQSGEFSLSILSENTPKEVIGRFGFFSSLDTDKFAETKYRIQQNLPVIEEACCGTMLFDVINVVNLETHSVIFGRLTETIAGTEKNPMTYSYYHKVVKGKAPKKAPTYQNTATEPEKKIWVCDVCGYEVEAKNLPEDYVCPVCKADRSHFYLKE